MTKNHEYIIFGVIGVAVVILIIALLGNTNTVAAPGSISASALTSAENANLAAATASNAFVSQNIATAAAVVSTMGANQFQLDEQIAQHSFDTQSQKVTAQTTEDLANIQSASQIQLATIGGNIAQNVATLQASAGLSETQLQANAAQNIAQLQAGAAKSTASSNMWTGIINNLIGAIPVIGGLFKSSPAQSASSTSGSQVFV